MTGLGVTRRVERAPALAVAVEGAALLLAAPLWIWWAVWKGGYPTAVFLPGIAYLALAAVVLHVFVPRPRLAGPAAWALGALALLAAWTLASLLWADDRGATEVASARQALLLASFALPLLWPPTARALVVGVALLPLAALAGGISALGAALDDPDALLDGRLVGPTGYVNATAALMATGLLPALALASRRELAPLVRAAALTVAAALGGLFVLTQSRGALAALALVLALALALIPGRLRLLGAYALALGAVLAVLDPLLEVRRAAVDDGDAAAALEDAVRALAWMAAALAPLALLCAVLDARVRAGARAVRHASRAAGIAAAAVAVAGAVALAASSPDVGGWVSERVEDFKTPDYERLESEQSRFTGDLGSNRYDYWRVSVEVFADSPLTGSGAGNFVAPFLERREADKATLYAHSLWLGPLAELGAVGLLALLGFAVALGWALVRAAGRARADRWLVVAAALPFAYLLVHGTVDWIAAFPVVAAPALALAAGGARLGTAAPRAASRGPASASLWLAVALAAAALAAAPLLASARLADRAATTWPQRPAGAIADLERAAELDPLAAAPYVRLGVVAIRLDRPGLAADAFEAALERDPSAWYSELQLGLLAAADGRRGVALDRLGTALERNPRELEVRRALRAVRAGRSPDAEAVQRRILARQGG